MAQARMRRRARKVRAKAATARRIVAETDAMLAQRANGGKKS
jgi:hypothetical protein